MGLIVHSSPTQESLMAPEVAVVLEGYTYFECPRWHENRIWVSDFYTYQVISACEDGTDIRVEAEGSRAAVRAGVASGRQITGRLHAGPEDSAARIRWRVGGARRLVRVRQCQRQRHAGRRTGTSVRGQLRVRSDEPGPGRDGRSPPRRPGRIGARRRARSPLPQRNGSDVDRRSARGRNAGKSNQCVCRPGRRLSG